MSRRVASGGRPEAVFFDFDGVLADSVHVKTLAFRRIFECEGEEVAEKVVAHHLANGGMSRFEKFEYYYRNFLKRDLDEATKRELCERFSELVTDEVVKAPAVPGAMEFLDRHLNRLLMAVVSGTPTIELREICRKRKIDRYFTEIVGSPESKGTNLKRILKSHQLNPWRCVFVGDALSDYRGAMQNGVPFIARVTAENEELFANLDVVRIPDLRVLEHAMEEVVRG